MTELYLEDALEATKHGLNASAKWVKRGGGGGGKGKGKGGQGRDDVGRDGKRIELSDRPDMELTEPELAHR